MGMRTHRVTFLSPGTLFSEQSDREIAGWDTHAAAQMAGEITERYGAKPYGFYFTEYVTAPPVPDGEGGTLEVRPREVQRSAMFYLGGEVLTWEQVQEREAAEPGKWDICLRNMRGNDEPLVIENRNSWRFTGAFDAEDAVVDAAGEVVKRGSEPELAAYRERKLREWEAERAVGRARWEEQTP
jgi:hypothetical protein